MHTWNPVNSLDAEALPEDFSIAPELQSLLNVLKIIDFQHMQIALYRRQLAALEINRGCPAQ